MVLAPTADAQGPVGIEQPKAATEENKSVFSKMILHCRTLFEISCTSNLGGDREC